MLPNISLFHEPEFFFVNPNKPAMTSPATSTTSVRSSKRIQLVPSATEKLYADFAPNDPLRLLFGRTYTNKAINRLNIDQLRKFLIKWNDGKRSSKEPAHLITQLPKVVILDRCYMIRDELDSAFHKDSIVGHSYLSQELLHLPQPSNNKIHLG